MDLQDDEKSGGGGAAFDLRYYWAVLKKRWWVMAACVATVASLSTVLTMRKPKIYAAAATVILDPNAPNALGDQQSEVVALGSGSVWTTSEYYNTQARIIKSEWLVRKVVEKFKLYSDERLMGRPSPTAKEDALIERAATIIREKISVTPIKDSRVFAIEVRDTNPALAADLANDITDVFIEQNLETKRVGTRDAKGFVASMLQEARNELKKSETELYTFKDQNKLLSVSWEDRQSMNSKALESFSDALNEAKKKRIELEARRRGVAKLLLVDSTSAPAGLVGEDSGISALRGGFLEQRRQLIGLQERYGPKHELVIAQQARVEAAFSDLQKEVASKLKAMDAELAALAETEARFSAEIDDLTRDALERNRKAMVYKELSREAEHAEQIYSALLSRFTESSLQEQDQSNNIRPLDAAVIPTVPVEPNVRTGVTMGIALGLMLAFAVAFLIEMLDRSVKSQDDIENVISLPFLGMVPSVLSVSDAVDEKGPPELYIARHQNSTVAECCRVVRTNILFSSPDKPLKTMLVTSSNPSEGKTMTVANLGIVMAQSGHRTLLVDTDMRRPRLNKAMGVPNDNGISRLILGESTYEEAIKSTDVPNLFVLPCGPHPPNPAELLQTDKFQQVLAGLCERFDRIIFDSPPVLAVTDSVVLSRLIDGTVLVVRAGRTPRDAVIRARQSMAAVGSRIIGVILNDVDMKNPHYSSYYNYYQYKYHDNAGKPAANGPVSGTT